MRYIFSFILILAHIAGTAQICGKVIDVHDGDSFTLLVAGNRQVKVRLHGIDCPELKQAYGRVAQKRAAALIAGKRMCIDSLGRDRYKRVIALVPLDTFTLNEQLLADGLAWHYKKYDNNPHWAQLEVKARNNKIGLWKEQPIAPWEWRKLK